MIQSAVFLAASVVGQICPLVVVEPPTVYVQPTQRIVIGAPLYLNYHLDGMAERSKFWATIPYKDGTEKRVPIINGYAPKIRYARCSNGAEIYDYYYHDRITYESILAKVREQKLERTKPKPKSEAPRLVPTPAPPRVLPKPPEPAPEPVQLVPVPDTGRSPTQNLEQDLPVVPEPSHILDPGLKDPTQIEEPRIRVSPSYKRN